MAAVKRTTAQKRRAATGIPPVNVSVLAPAKSRKKRRSTLDKLQADFDKLCEAGDASAERFAAWGRRILRKLHTATRSKPAKSVKKRVTTR